MQKKLVTIGGGGGHSRVLAALKDISDITITGICPSTDSGGSTGLLQEQYGGSGYVGDITKCMLALSGDKLLAEALLYRYGPGGLHGHSVKNLLFHALEKGAGTQEALRVMGRVCGLGLHRVIPVTHEKTTLYARLDIGNEIEGETNIDNLAKNPLWNPTVHSIKEIFLRPNVSASHDATSAVEDAAYLVVCPGDLYSSIIPVLLPAGMRSAVERSQARIVVILNLMTKKGETDNYTGLDFVCEIEKHLGRPADHIICNNAPIPHEVLVSYALENKVELDSISQESDPRIRCLPLARVGEHRQLYSDPRVIRQAIEEILA